MKMTRWRLVFPGLLLALWLFLSLTAATYASSPARPRSDDCKRYIMNPENIVVAPRAMIEDCMRTPGPQGFATAITAYIIALALTGAFGAAAQEAVQQALLASSGLPVRGVLPPDQDPFRLTTYPDDNEWRNRVARDMWQAELEGRDPERVIEMYASHPQTARDLRNRYQGYRNSGLRGPGDIPAKDLGASPVAGGEILSGQRATNYLIREGAALKDKDGHPWIPTSAIKDRPDIQGGAYHTTTREVWNPKAYRYERVEVIDGGEVAIIKR